MPRFNTRTPIETECATIFVSIELSQKSWLIGVYRPDLDRISRHKLAAGDHADLVSRLLRLREEVSHALDVPVRVLSCYEAGYDGFWLHRALVVAGIGSHVFDPASIAVNRRARRAKTDRIDVEQLLRTLMAYHRGEPQVVRVVGVPSPDQEDARRRMRERERLVKERTAHSNRIKSLLRTLGLAAGKVHRGDWPAWLAHQRDWQGHPVPPRLRAELLREHARLMTIHEQLAELAAEAVPGITEAEAALATTAGQLQRFKGLGPVFSATLAGEVFWKPFTNRRQVGSFVGLTPTPWQSGGVAREQGIVKAGNRRARATAIELAWLWLRHQPQSALSRWYEERTRDGDKRARRIAIVALARKILVALWRFLTTGLVPTGAILEA